MLASGRLGRHLCCIATGTKPSRTWLQMHCMVLQQSTGPFLSITTNYLLHISSASSFQPSTPPAKHAETRRRNQESITHSMEPPLSMHLSATICCAAQAVQRFLQDTLPAVHAADHPSHTQPGQGLLPEHSGGHADICGLVQGAPPAEDNPR